MATKEGKIVTYYEGLPPINSHKSLNMYVRSMDKFKTLYFHYNNTFGPANLSEWWNTTKNSHPWSHITSPPLPDLQWGNLLMSCDKANTLVLYLQNTYRYQTRERLLPHKSTWHFPYVTNLKSRDKLKNLFFDFHQTYSH